MDENNPMNNNVNGAQSTGQLSGSQPATEMPQSAGVVPQQVESGSQPEEVAPQTMKEPEPVINELQPAVGEPQKVEENSKPVAQSEQPQLEGEANKTAAIEPSDPKVDPQKQKNDSKKTVIIVLSIAIIAIVVAIIALVLIMNNNNNTTSGSGEGNNMQNTNTTSSAEQKPQVSPNNSSDISDSVEIDDSFFVSDETKLVLEMGSTESYVNDGEPEIAKVYLVYTYSGDEITGLKSYLEYADAETAKSVYDIESESFEDINNVAVNGKYLVLISEPENYEGLTVKDVKEQMEFLESLKNTDFNESMYEGDDYYYGE